MRHSKTPHHQAADSQASQSAKLTNPLCGDEVTLFLRLEKNTVARASFQGQCCALCTASASMLTQEVQTLDTEKAAKMARSLIKTIKEDGDLALIANRSPDIPSLAGVAAFPSRKRCVTLPWEALLAALAADTPQEPA